jgi:hypothetical protein
MHVYYYYYYYTHNTHTTHCERKPMEEVKTYHEMPNVDTPACQKLFMPRGTGPSLQLPSMVVITWRHGSCQHTITAVIGIT